MTAQANAVAHDVCGEIPDVWIKMSHSLREEDVETLKQHIRAALKSRRPPMVLPDSPHCPATTRHTPLHSLHIVGLQCKFLCGHDGDHAASPGVGQGDVFW